MTKKNTTAAAANSAQSNNNLKNGNAISNREMYNYSRQGWCEAHWFYTTEMEFADDNLKFAQAPNGYIALLDNWYSGVVEHYIKIDGQWFELNDEAIEEVKAARMKKFEEKHGKARVEEIKKEVEEKVAELNAQMAAKEENTTELTSGELFDRSEWPVDANIFAKNYRGQKSYKGAPVGAVAIVTVNDKPEYWNKTEDDKWRRVTHKEFIIGYKEYASSMVGQIRTNVVDVVNDTFKWLESEEGKNGVEEGDDNEYICFVHTADRNISIKSYLSDGMLYFDVWTKYSYVEGEADMVMNEETQFHYKLDHLDKEKIIADIDDYAARIYTDPADVCVGRRYRSSEGDTYTVTKVKIITDNRGDSDWHIELKSDEYDTELWCELDREDWDNGLGYFRWKISWNDTDEWIDFNDDDSLIL